MTTSSLSQDPHELVTSSTRHQTTDPCKSPTSTTLSLPNKSRFNFHSDTKVPPQLSILERETYIRYTAFASRLNAIDRQIALWTSRHTNEVIDRDLQVVGLFKYLVSDPLERCSERVLDKLERDLGALWGSKLKKRGFRDNVTDNINYGSDCNNADPDEEEKAGWIVISPQNNTSRICEGEARGGDNDDPLACNMPERNEKDHSTTASATNENPPEENRDPVQSNALSPKKARSPTTIRSLSVKCNRLSNSLNTFLHRTIPEQCHKSLESIHQNQLHDDLPPKIHLERTKSTKREGFIVRRFESIAGISLRSLVEENSERLASLTILEEKISNAGGLDDVRVGRFLAEVKEIRKMLELERKERVRQDEVVLDRLVETRETLQRYLKSVIQD